jgi:hypothetical protein
MISALRAALHSALATRPSLTGERRSFRLDPLSARTLRAAVRAVGPRPPLAPIGIEEHALADIERQMRRFPLWHRLGIVAGLAFIEWGGPIGGWGLSPFSLLSPSAAAARYEALMHSAFPPARLLTHSLKALICLSVYGHARVEEGLGFERRRWRRQRLATREALTAHLSARALTAPEPPPPAALTPADLISGAAYLAWDAHERLARTGAALPPSPLTPDGLNLEVAAPTTAAPTTAAPTNPGEGEA